MKLTEKKSNRYFALAQADEIIHKLEKIESGAPLLLAKICDDYCMFPQVLPTQVALDAQCERCPMKELVELIE